MGVSARARRCREPARHGCQPYRHFAPRMHRYGLGLPVSLAQLRAARFRAQHYSHSPLAAPVTAMMTPACWAGVRLAHGVLKFPGPVKSGFLDHFQVWLDERLRIGLLAVHPHLGGMAGLAVLRFRGVGRHVHPCGDATGGDTDGAGLGRFSGQGRQLTGGRRRRDRCRRLLLVRRAAGDCERQQCGEYRRRVGGTCACRPIYATRRRRLGEPAPGPAVVPRGEIVRLIVNLGRFAPDRTSELV